MWLAWPGSDWWSWGTDADCKSALRYFRIANPKELGVVGIEEYESNDDNGIAIFPNPSDGQVTILTDGIVEAEAKIDIIDLAGKIVLSKPIANVGVSYFEVSLAELGSGLYIVRLTTSEEQYSAKLIIK